MRSRSNSGARLDYYQRLVHKTILDHQNPVTGLIRSSSRNDHAWVRDSVYSIMAVWALSMAYKKNADLDEDRAKTYELEQSCVKLMRGLLMSMMKQKEKLESFKETQNKMDALHAKYSSQTGATVETDSGWGHLQMDATSLYLLTLAQMTASGLQIIFNLDEVAFIQNLVFYIESAYCIPDYGIWERGDKTNHGLPELNASSIGMAKAALEAMNELDLFGGRGGPSSVIHVLADEAQKCHAVLQSMLPRESNSKEVDAALLSVIGFPAFAVENPELIKLTRDTIEEKLRGRYGCRRFLRDGYKTAKEDSKRLYYEPWELKVFENIECEWPLFFCYYIIDACFRGDRETVEEFSEALDSILIKENGLKLVPELYTVPVDKVDLEYQNPHSQERVAIGQKPFIWAQSLYIVGRLLQEGFLAPGELDPLNRRLCSEQKPDVVVQVVILAEDHYVKEKLKNHEIHAQTISEVAPVEVQPARVLSHIYSYLGQNKKLSLSGRYSREVGLLSTSKLYTLQDRIFAFTPQFVDQQQFYLASDTDLLIDTFKTEIAFLKTSWHMLGRPTVVLNLQKSIIVNDIELLASTMRSDIAFLRTNWLMLGRPTMCLKFHRYYLEQDKVPLAMISTIKKLKSGYINGTRVALGTLEDFQSTSCVTSLSFLHNQEEGDPESLNSSVRDYLEKELNKCFLRPTLPYGAMSVKRKKSSMRSRRSGVSGIIKRTRSIQVDKYDPDLVNLRERYEKIHSPPPISPGLEGLSVHSESPYSSPTESGGRTPSPSVEPDEVDSWNTTRVRTLSDRQYDNVNDEDLVIMFKETESLEEQGDILHYLVGNRGVNWDTGLGGQHEVVTIKDLLKDLYEKACHEKKWALVRHIAGMLGKKVEDLAKAVTDLLVRQKQVTIGMPSTCEETITRPIPSKDLIAIIHSAHGSDQSTAMLTQELLVYLAMFIRTEPQLFMEMLRLRVGLIIQVMASELARSLKCSGDEASEHLLNLSPFEVKMLLHHILSGKEFVVKSARSGVVSVANPSKVQSKKSVVDIILGKDGQSDEGNFESDRQGQWLRRRRLDGALNRVPRGFYPRIWSVLERCQGLSVEGKILNQQLTREMTPGELKFALEVETVLNSIPQPEYRQLMVEALMILTLLVEHDAVKTLGGIINVEHLVHKANQIFLEDQKHANGDATICCAAPTNENPCGGAAGICQHFYDSAPSGCYGTMTYLIRSVASTMDCLPKQELDCTIS
ncbi:probable phosphorylase b kinase regulatory subunit alpha [Nephila pilipes]|uniref:Phosphorylase b kinase regulatory subunit n=1 Tax=Nephila pilipes TaxID=299642 RepID=A0A8X6NIH4_NEPPI|nr:probable phosphorylase b kinase regulatory subunit alpha [Nephila pilipes]